MSGFGAEFATNIVTGEVECGDCGSLLCVKQRSDVNGDEKNPVRGLLSNVVTTIEYDVEVAADVDRIICAGCGAVLWERDE